MFKLFSKKREPLPPGSIYVVLKEGSHPPTTEEVARALKTAVVEGWFPAPTREDRMLGDNVPRLKGELGSWPVLLRIYKLVLSKFEADDFMSVAGDKVCQKDGCTMDGHTIDSGQGCFALVRFTFRRR